MTLDCGLIGGDLDSCRDPATGVIAPWEQEVIDRRETYFEISPSGRGVRFFSLTDVPLRETVHRRRRRAVLDRALSDVHRRQDHRDAAGVRTSALRHRDADAVGGGRQARRKPRPRRRPLARPKRLRDRSRRSPTAKPIATRRWAGSIRRRWLTFDAWVPELLPDAEKTASGGYRVKSRDLGRPLEEDLSISPDGIKDFGRPRSGRRARRQTLADRRGDGMVGPANWARRRRRHGWG